MSLTTDRSDPRLGHGADDGPVPQNDAYLILSGEERAKGLVRPVRRSYRHAGTPGPRYELRDLTAEERERYGGRYVKYEPYPESERPSLGSLWTQERLDSIGKGCGAVTTMAAAIAETYAREPSFYGATYCCACRRHLPVGPQGAFTWMDADGSDTGERVGT